MKTIAILALAACLSSCWTPPVAIVVRGNYGDYTYSAKRGFEISIDATK